MWCPSTKMFQNFVLTIFLVTWSIKIFPMAETSIPKEVIPCIWNLCDQYFFSIHALRGNLIIVNIKQNDSVFQEIFLKEMHVTLNYGWSVMMKDSLKKHKNAAHVIEKARNYFMVLTSLQDLFNNVKQLKALPTWNPLSTFVVMFGEAVSKCSAKQWTLDIIRFLRSYSAVDVNVLFNIENTTEIHTYTWFPYENGSCAKDVKIIKLLDVCSLKSGIVSYHKKVPKIPVNLQKCVVKFGTAIWEPFVLPLKYSSRDINATSRNVPDKGLEILLIKTMAFVYNFEIQVQVKTSVSQMYIYENGSASGIFEDILRGEVDAGIGGLGENRYTRRWLDGTTSYLQDDVTWCVPKAGPSSRWNNVFTIFSYQTWFASIITLIIVGYVVRYVTIFDRCPTIDLSHGLLWSLATALGLPGMVEPSSVALRIIFIAWIFFGLHFSTAYHSLLISVITKPRFEHQIESISELLQSQLGYGGGSNELIFHLESFDKEILESFTICASLDDCLMRLANQRDFAVSISRKHAEYNEPDKIFCFPKIENVYTYSVVMLVRKNFHLLDHFNTVIRKVTECGLITKWEHDSQPSINIHQINDDEEIILSLEHLQGGFFIWIIGIIASMLLFLIENFMWFKLKLFNKFKETRGRKRKRPLQ